MNKCVEVEHLKESIDQGTLMYSQKLSMAREPTTDDYNSQRTQRTLDSYSKINDLMLMEWNPLEGGN